MNAEQLHPAEAAYRADFARAEQSRRERNDAVRAALAAGQRPFEVAREFGITRGRVAQIATANQPPAP